MFDFWFSSWTDSSEDDEGLDVGEEEQEQLLAEVLRENRQLEVGVLHNYLHSKNKYSFSI